MRVAGVMNNYTWKARRPVLFKNSILKVPFSVYAFFGRDELLKRRVKYGARPRRVMTHLFQCDVLHYTRDF